MGSGKVAPIDAKINVIMQIPPPVTKKELRSFLGVVGFYRRFVPRFSETASLLTDLLRGERKGAINVKWTQACQKAFESLKGSLAIVRS